MTVRMTRCARCGQQAECRQVQAGNYVPFVCYSCQPRRQSRGVLFPLRRRRRK